jgi:hypothetical protein
MGRVMLSRLLLSCTRQLLFEREKKKKMNPARKSNNKKGGKFLRPAKGASGLNSFPRSND